MKISEIKQALRKNEYIIIRPSMMDDDICLKRNQHVKIPEHNSEGIKNPDVAFTFDEIRVLKTLDLDNRNVFMKTMYMIKSVFKHAHMVIMVIIVLIILFTMSCGSEWNSGQVGFDPIINGR